MVQPVHGRDRRADCAPSRANLEALFPVWNDASTWNLAPLSPLTTQVFHAVSDTEHRYNIVRHLFAGWVQDDWRIGDSLTLNLGVRYDWDTNAHSEKLELLPFLPGNLPHDNNNVAPRMGVNFRLNDRTVLRGGYGLFFAFSPNDGVQQSYSMVHRFEYQIANNGRPDFVPNWFGPGASGEGEFGGPRPTLGGIAGARVRHQQRARLCPARDRPGNQLPGPPDAIQPPGVGRCPAPVRRHDVIRGELRVHVGTPRGDRAQRESELQPGYRRELHFTDISRRPFPDWGVVLLEYLEG